MMHGDVLGERARLTPDRLALVDVASGARLSYADLDRRAAACAALWLDGLGLRKGERFGVLSGNRLEFLDAFFAAGKSGVILVPLGTRLTAPELAAIVKDAELSGLFHDAASAATVRELAALTPIGRTISFDDEYAALVGGRSPERLALHSPKASALNSPEQPAPASSSPEREPFRRASPDDIYMLCYTSGTTGTPKGVMIPHRMIAWNGYNTAACWDLGADDVSPIFTPLYHVGGLCAFLVPIVTAGGTIVLHARFDVDEVWTTIVGERCTVVLGVPTIWRLLMEAPQFATVNLSAVRAFYSGGAPLPQFIIDAYQQRGVVFKQGYGLTEAGVNCFSMTVEESRRKAGTIGRPMMFTEARIVAGDDGHDAAPDEVGELWLRGPHVCLGYWRNPAATAAALDADGWFHTGDLAKRDEEGFFSIAGRQKDMIISGGVNVYPAEIEAQLLQHPHVRDAAVVGVPDETWGEAGAAFVVPGDDRPDADALQQFLLTRLAKFKLPKHWIFVDSLPRTPYGKVVKPQLRERFVKS
jgi:fatty-acyl-CoA synthase